MTLSFDPKDSYVDMIMKLSDAKVIRFFNEMGIDIDLDRVVGIEATLADLKAELEALFGVFDDDDDDDDDGDDDDMDDDDDDMGDDDDDMGDNDK